MEFSILLPVGFCLSIHILTKKSIGSISNLPNVIGGWKVKCFPEKISLSFTEEITNEKRATLHTLLTNVKNIN